MAAATKQARTTGIRMPPSFLTLPLPLVSHVLEFAVYDFTLDLVPSPRSLPLKYLRTFALVSKTWRQLMLHIVKQFKRETMQLQLTSDAPSELKTIRDDVELQGRDVRDLRVTIGRPNEYSYGTTDFMNKSLKTEEATIDWGALLVHLTGLKRLDLKLVPLESRHLPLIIEAAGKHCQQIEALILPRKPDLEQEIKGPAIKKLMEVLYAAVERWYKKGSCGGLRQLTVPTRDDAERFQRSTEFIENVTRFCPNVEFLDGPVRALHDFGSVKCADKWMISLETWEKFNATCTKLCNFYWAPVPFADPYFRVFGAHPKLQLTYLNVSANLLWDWKEFFRASGDTAAASKTGKPGFGRRAQELGAVFEACPALTCVSVEMDLHEYAQGRKKLFDINVFGDEFWESLATHCPLLESIRIEDCAGYEIEVVKPIETFTDAALLNLADLKYLSSFESNASMMCTGNGFFEYLRRVSKSSEMSGDWCLLALRVGGQQHGMFGPPSFYAELVTLLRRLSETSEEELGAVASGQKLNVVMINPYRSTVSRTWSAAYMRDELQPLLESVKTMHPGLNMNFSASGRTRQSFKQIERVSFSWHPRDIERPLFWDDGDDSEDDTFEDPSVDMADAFTSIFHRYNPNVGHDFGRVFLEALMSGNGSDEELEEEDSD